MIRPTDSALVVLQLHGARQPVIEFTDTWSYFVTDAETPPPSDWNELDFDDSEWLASGTRLDKMMKRQ